jgi:hypothetical protein
VESSPLIRLGRRSRSFETRLKDVGKQPAVEAESRGCREPGRKRVPATFRSHIAHEAGRIAHVDAALTDRFPNIRCRAARKAIWCMPPFLVSRFHANRSRSSNDRNHSFSVPASAPDNLWLDGGKGAEGAISQHIPDWRTKQCLFLNGASRKP